MKLKAYKCPNPFQAFEDKQIKHVINLNNTEGPYTYSTIKATLGSDIVILRKFKN